jgi:hypothetical protein
MTEWETMLKSLGVESDGIGYRFKAGPQVGFVTLPVLSITACKTPKEVVELIAQMAFREGLHLGHRRLQNDFRNLMGISHE